MKTSSASRFAFFFALALPLAAQTPAPSSSILAIPRRTTVSTEGTANVIAKFDASGGLVNSSITHDSSGINLIGHTYLTSGRFFFAYPAVAGNGSDMVGLAGGTMTFATGFNSEAMFTGTAGEYSGRQLYFYDAGANRMRAVVDSTGTWWFGTAPTNYTLRVVAPMAGTVTGVTINEAGRVGIGMAPDALHTLKVSGDAHFAGKVTGQNIQAHYQDVAEWVPSAEDLAPGTVVVLDQRTDNTVKASYRPYDTMVAGVVSAQPGLILGEAAATKEQIATTGRVRVKVDASRGPIAIGDILVTGTVRGTAMKSTPVEVAGIEMHRPGTIIGKALEPLAGGVGEILVLLSMQ